MLYEYLLISVVIACGYWGWFFVRQRPHGTATFGLMQIGAAATVTSVDYAITPGGGSGTLPPAFNAVNGQAPVTAPGTAAAYNIMLTWH